MNKAQEWANERYSEGDNGKSLLRAYYRNRRRKYQMILFLTFMFIAWIILIAILFKYGWTPSMGEGL